MPDPTTPDPTTPDPSTAKPIIFEPIRRLIEFDPDALRNVIVEIGGGSMGTSNQRRTVEERIAQVISDSGDRSEQTVLPARNGTEISTIHSRLQGKVILALVALDGASAEPLITGVSPDSDERRLFNPDNMIRSVISVPMLNQIAADPEHPHSVMIEINAFYSEGREAAKKKITGLVTQAFVECGIAFDPTRRLTSWKGDSSQQYVYARMRGSVIQKLAELDGNVGSIYHIWPDFRLRAQIWKSNGTVKADASRRAFATSGRNIVWAVLDSGIDGTHPHFDKYKNLVLPSGLQHMDFTGNDLKVFTDGEVPGDPYGHGTHVAGIIAGELDATKYLGFSLYSQKKTSGAIGYGSDPVLDPISGMAPECKLLSYRVLDENGEGDVSTVIAAIQRIQEINGYGRQIVVHGVNMSLGYDFDPEWFACGQSPVCVEVDRLVRSGVAVVVAAGNTGKGFALTINDPGNAELAITVGATHRDMPHRYGVSYFSSKGPTGDGRRKPDLLAPGERIISCGVGPDMKRYQDKAAATQSPVAAPADPADPSLPAKIPAYYMERSGTSMATPHVSGIIAGMLSVRTEFIGLPEEIKKTLIANATDLGREPSFQGGGLVDMMRSIQSI